MSNTPSTQPNQPSTANPTSTGKPRPVKKRDRSPQSPPSAPKTKTIWDPSDLTIGEFALNLGAFVSFAFLGCVAIYNIHVYQGIFERLLDLPWAWLQWLMGLTAWVLIQIAELMPYLIENETGFMSLLAVSISVFPKVEEKSSNPSATRIIRRINSFPQDWLWWSNAIASGVFLVDLVLVGWYFTALTWNWIIPQINIVGVFQTVITVGMFEAAFVFALHATSGRWFVSKGKQSMEEQSK